jgi:hypothetical protein
MDTAMRVNVAATALVVSAWGVPHHWSSIATTTIMATEQEGNLSRRHLELSGAGSLNDATPAFSTGSLPLPVAILSVLEVVLPVAPRAGTRMKPDPELYTASPTSDL